MPAISFEMHLKNWLMDGYREITYLIKQKSDFTVSLKPFMKKGGGKGEWGKLLYIHISRLPRCNVTYFTYFTIYKENTINALLNYVNYYNTTQ